MFAFSLLQLVLAGLFSPIYLIAVCGTSAVHRGRLWELNPLQALHTVFVVVTSTPPFSVITL